MTKSLTDTELPRFSRRIGVSDLAEFGERSDERPPIGVLRPFAGILDTTVRPDRSRHAMPRLAYLTLAPLVTRELATEDERDERAGRTGTDTGAPTGNESTGADERAKEPRVRDVLRDETGERTAYEPTTAEEVGEDTDRGGSELIPLERTAPDTRNEPPDTESGGSSPTDLTGWRSENVRDDALGTTGPPKTLVDRSDFDLDHPPALGTADTGGGVTVPSEGWLGSDIRKGSVTAGQSGPATPTMRLLGEPGGGRDEPRSDAGDSLFAVGEAGPDSRDTPRAGAGPELTVKRTGRSAQTPETTDPGDRDVGGPAQSRAGWRAGPPSERDGSSTEGTVIAEDGTVNHRVLDRLYQELKRKRRIERSREGR